MEGKKKSTFGKSIHATSKEVNINDSWWFHAFLSLPIRNYLFFQISKSHFRVVACKSACLAFNTDQYCCRGAYGTPDTCQASQYGKIFKQVRHDTISKIDKRIFIVLSYRLFVRLWRSLQYFCLQRSWYEESLLQNSILLIFLCIAERPIIIIRILFWAKIVNMVRGNNKISYNVPLFSVNTSSIDYLFL